MDCIRSAEKSYSFRLLCEQSEVTLKAEADKKFSIQIDNVYTVPESDEYNENDNVETENIDVTEEQDIETTEIEKDSTDTENDTLKKESEEPACDEDCKLVSVSEILNCKHTCQICDFGFPTTTALNKHIASHRITPTYYRCQLCPKQ